VYPEAGSTGISVAAEGGRASLTVDVWELEPAIMPASAADREPRP
jgi:hypothetical protein